MYILGLESEYIDHYNAWNAHSQPMYCFGCQHLGYWVVCPDGYTGVAFLCCFHSNPFENHNVFPRKILLPWVVLLEFSSIWLLIVSAPLTFNLIIANYSFWQNPFRNPLHQGKHHCPPQAVLVAVPDFVLCLYLV